MIIYVTTKSGGVFTVDKRAAEAIVYNTRGWVAAFHNGAPALINSWDVEAIQAGDDEARAFVEDLAIDYTKDCGYPFIERE